jgi:hypothetical protein
VKGVGEMLVFKYLKYDARIVEEYAMTFGENMFQEGCLLFTKFIFL